MKNMYRVGPVWYLRKQIPADLRHHYGGKVDIRRSLGTGDKRKAEQKLHGELAKLGGEFDVLRMEGSTEAEEARALVRDIGTKFADHELLASLDGADEFLAAVEEALLARGKLPATQEQLNAIEESIRDGARPVANHNGLSTIEQINSAIGTIRAERIRIEQHGIDDVITADLDGEPTAPFPLHLVEDVRAFIIQRLKEQETQLEAVAARLSGKPVEQAFTSLWTIYEKWKLERKPAPRTLNEFKTAIKRFDEINGSLKVAEITADHGRKFKDTLVASRLKSASVQKQLSCVKTLLSYAADNAVISENPLARIRMQRAKDRTDREDFAPDDFKKLFGSVERGSERYWIMRIAQYTGMRLSEICQLGGDDIFKSEDIWCISINKNDGKALKTESSRRVIPVHETILNEGFLDFVPKEGRLFPSARPDGKANPGRLVSRWFTRYRREVGITSERKVFHSFRHTFITAAREVMSEETYTKITGHSTGKVNRGYGKISIRKLKEAIDRVTF
jgi:integrase